MIADYRQGKIRQPKSGRPSVSYPPFGNRPLPTPLTPKELLESFWILSDDDKTAFLELFGQNLNAESAWLVVNALPIAERERFTDILQETMVALIYPVLVKEARELAKRTHDLTDDQFDKELADRVTESSREYSEAIGQREAAKLKQQRDRKSNPDIVRRNIEICTLRNQDPTYWSQGRLAKKFKLKASRAIRLILEQESKWRLLAAQQRTN